MSSNGPSSSSKNDRAETCCIEFGSCSENGLTVINFSPELLSRFQEMVKSSWHKGIQPGIQSLKMDKKVPNSYFIKLHGSLWSRTFGFWPFSDSQQRATDATNLARLLLGLSRFMISEGWAMEGSITVENCIIRGSHPPCRLTWTFTESREKLKSSELRPALCFIAFNEADKIRVVDGHREVLDAMQSTIEHFWQKRLQKRNTSGETKEFMLRGRPWYDVSASEWRDAKTKGAWLLVELLHALENVGWKIYGAVEHNSFGMPPEDTFVSTERRWILKKCANGATDP